MTGLATIALDGDLLGLSLVRGMVASVNPCGFVLLPTYLVYFLGLGGDHADGGDPAGLRRALLVGGAVSGGFMTVFLAAGIVTQEMTRWFLERAFYATAIVGLGLIVLGVAMLCGYRLPISTPALGVRAERRTVGTMFLYGCAFAVASIGCSMGLFISTMYGSGRREGVWAGAANGAAYALGMTLVVMSLTITLALTRSGLVTWLRSSMRHVERVAAVMVIVSGVYLVYYFWVVDVRNDSDAVTSRVDRIGTWLTARIDQHWEIVAVVLGAIVVAAAAAVMLRRDRREATP